MQGKPASQGASLLCGGQRVEGELADGLFYEPTVLGGVNKDMLITYQETFGQVAPIIPFDTEEEVIELANNTEYGLAAYFFTQNISRGFRVSEAPEFGIIGNNDAIPTAFPPHLAAWGGKAAIKALKNI